MGFFNDLLKPKNLFKTALGVGLFFVGGGSGALIAKSFGANILLGEAAKLLGPKPPKQRLSPQTVTLRGTNLPGQIIYGETRTAGMLYIPPGGVSGERGKYLHHIIVLACHELDYIGDIWLDNEKVEAANIDVDGNVTGGKFAGKLIIERFYGTDDQAASTMLVDAFPEWTTDFRGRGIAYLHLRMERDDEAFPSLPQNIFAVVRGRKVFDPRSNATAYSDNPALCTRDYLTHFCGVEVDEALAIAAANTCDQELTVPSGTQKRYRCAGVISTGDEPPENVERLLSAMNGTGDPAPGKFRMFAGQYHVPALTIDETWMAGEITVQLQTPSREIFNLVRGEYIDPERNWQPVPCWPQTIGSYVTQDGRELPTSVALPMTFDEYQAQRQCYQQLLRSRGQRVIELPLNRRVMHLRVWDTVNVSLALYGINEVYRVMKWSNEGTVTLREESSGYYAAPPYTDAVTVNVGATVPSSPNAPNNFQITPGSGGALLTWVNPPAREFDQIEIYRSLTNDFETATLRATVRASSYFDVTEGGQEFFYWIRSTNGRGGFSQRLPQEAGAPGSGAPPTTGSLQATLSQSSLSVAQVSGSDVIFGNVLVYATGGSPPYTYAWERVTGSTDITALTPAAINTGFQCLAGTNQTKVATFKCVVTDDTTATVDSPTISISAYFYTSGGGGGYEEP